MPSMKVLSMTAMTAVLALMLSACNQSSGSSSPVSTPTAAFVVPTDAPECLQRKWSFRDQTDLCRRVSSDSAIAEACDINGQAQIRYEYFQTHCNDIPKLSWQNPIPVEPDHDGHDDRNRRQVHSDSANQ